MVEIKGSPGFGFLESIDLVNVPLWILCWVLAVLIFSFGAFLAVKAYEKLSAD
jgi:hypothetical protein